MVYQTAHNKNHCEPKANSMLLRVENTPTVHHAQVHNQNSQSSQRKLEKSGMQKSTHHAFSG